MKVKREKVIVTNSKAHRGKNIKLFIEWDTRIGEWVLCDNKLFYNHYSLEVLKDMIKILEDANKESGIK